MGEWGVITTEHDAAVVEEGAFPEGDVVVLDEVEAAGEGVVCAGAVEAEEGLSEDVVDEEEEVEGDEDDVPGPIDEAVEGGGEEEDKRDEEGEGAACEHGAVEFAEGDVEDFVEGV